MSKTPITFINSGRFVSANGQFLPEMPCAFDDAPQALDRAMQVHKEVLRMTTERDEGIFSDAFIRNEVKRIKARK